MILAIDTSGEQASVSVSGPEGPETELNWTAGRDHARSLSRVLGQMREHCGLDYANVTAVVVALGPGSFTGTRVGVSAAKGLCFALDVPLVGVGTLELVAYQSRYEGERVLACADAGRQQVYVQEYRTSRAEVDALAPISIVGFDEVISRAEDEILVAGPAAQVIAAAARATGREVRIQAPASRLRRASFLAELGEQYLKRGERSQLELLEPLYVRKSAAEEKRER